MAYFRCTGEGGSPAPVVSEPYIYNVGDVGFNSGHTHTVNTKVRLKGIFGTWDGYGQAFGARANNYNNSAMGFFSLFGGQRCCYYRSGQEKAGEYYANAETSTSMWYTQPIVVECEGQTMSWWLANDPNNVHTLTAESSTVNAGIAPLGIFCVNNTTTTNGWDAFDPVKYMSLFWFEIYENDVLVHKFVPAYNNGQYCLYDEVDQTYIYECNGNYSRLRGSPDIPTT